MEVILFILAVIVLGAIITLVNQAINKKVMSKYLARLSDFSVTQEIMGEDGKTGIAFDETRKVVCLIEKHGKKIINRIFGYRDLLSAELCEDGTTIKKTYRSSQFGGALLGGVVFGPLGAVVGGLSGKQETHNKVKRIDLQIVVNETKNPTHLVNFLNVETKQASTVYKQAIKKAKHWTNLIEVLIKQADRIDKNENHTNQGLSENQTIATELCKLAELRDSEILSEEEFQAQKQKLLSK